MDAINTETNETLIERAIENETPISFRYWSSAFEAGGERQHETPERRTVSPYEFKDGKGDKTLLVCWSHAAERVRYFDIERIGGIQSEAEVEEFVRPVTA